MALFGNKKTTDSQPAAKAAPVSMKDLYSEAPAAKAAKAGEKGKKAASQALYPKILVKPLITEKATNLGAENKYAFVVVNSANKISVAKAVEETYGVRPVAVNLMNVGGKLVRRGRVSGKRKDWKKAVVTLKKGETIKIYEGV